MSTLLGLCMGIGSPGRLRAVASLLLGCIPLVNLANYGSAQADSVASEKPTTTAEVVYNLGVRQEPSGQDRLHASLTLGELKSTTKAIALNLDTTAILELVERLKATSVDERFPKYYLESRGFQEPKIVVKLQHEDYLAPSIFTFPFAESLESALMVHPARPIRFISVDLTGQREQWACFDPATCALQGNVQGSAFTVFEGRSDVAKMSADIFQCGRGQTVSYQLSDTQNQSLWLPLSLDDNNRGAPSHVTGRGQAPFSCQEFPGFSGELTWTNGNGSGEVLSRHTYGRFTVRLESDRVVADYEILPHKLCEFERPSYDGRSYPVEYRVDINQRCTNDITPGGLGDLRLLREQIFADSQILTRVTDPCACVSPVQ